MRGMLKKNHCCQDKGNAFEETIYTSTRATRCFDVGKTQQYRATTSAESKRTLSVGRLYDCFVLDSQQQSLEKVRTPQS